MSDLLRILYISRATFDGSPRTEPVAETGEPGLEQLAPPVRQILIQSRANNPRQGLVGMLFYDSGFFFQCIEGERPKVEALFRRLSRDPRHRNIKLLAHHPVQRLSFPDWAMKYVPVDHHARHLLEQHGFDSFDPYRFDDHLIERMLHLMQGTADPTSASADGRPETSVLQAGVAAPGPDPSPARSLALGALALSAVALLISLGTCAYVALSG